MNEQIPGRRNKLGLALAGGGFRASLFHLGVLRRMAELDLLRYVEVLSTVSGGSIIGALYALLLKKHLENPETKGRLGRDAYLALVDELQQTLLTGIQKNLRLRLFRNPLGILRVLVTPQSLGRRMARLYERHVYRSVVDELEPGGWWRSKFRPGRIPLRRIRINPGGSKMRRGIEAYNREVVAASVSRPPDEPPGSVVTKLVLNATSLNSGARFWFASSEIGDWFLGHFRHSEVRDLLRRKLLLEDLTLEELEEALGQDGAEITLRGEKLGRDPVAFAWWWRARAGGPARAAAPQGWEPLFEQVKGFPGRLPEAEFGRLRMAKLAAWYVRKGPEIGVTGGVDEAEQLNRFWAHLRDIDPEQTARLRPVAAGDRGARDQLLDFILELYWFRSAAVVSPRIARDWETLTLGDAVGASACFPPVFPPFQVLAFYDDWHVSRLALTDGGVFDNIGLTALLDEGCDHVIVSDTSGVFGVQERASAGRLGMMARITSILMADVAWNQRDGLRERRRVSRQITDHVATADADRRRWVDFHKGRELHGLAFFHISSPPPGLPNTEPPGLDLGLDRDALARIRTDLDGFGDVEIAALVNHGYATADRHIRRYLGDVPYRNDAYWAEPPEAPLPLAADGRAERIIEVGRSRFGRALKLWAPASWLFVLVVAAFVVAGLWRIRHSTVSVSRALGWLGERAAGAIDAGMPWLGTGWTQKPLSVGLIVLILLAGVSIWLGVRRILGFNLAEWFHRRGALGWARRASWLAKWARGTAGNLLWPLAGLPLLIAAVSSVFAWLSYIFFHLPFLRRTRMR